MDGSLKQSLPDRPNSFRPNCSILETSMETSGFLVFKC
eukprot:06495.XXX_169057_169170_1 [CDS] Oithona nana genome sequencing.